MWDEKYNVEDYIYGIEPNDFLREHFTALPKGDVLCLAEGEGRNAVFLAKNGYNVTAVDSSSVGLEKAKRLANENSVSIEFNHSDLSLYDLGENRWDGIVSIFCHVPEEIRKMLHKRIVKSLKPSGVLLLEAYTPAQLKHGTGGPPTTDMMFSEILLREELEGIEFSRLIELEREIVEGSYHSGLGAVVQAIGSPSEI